MTDEKKDQFELEETPEITIGDGNVGTFLKVIAAILITICLIYLFTHFKHPAAPTDKQKATEQTK
jgi:hypothetical protein